MKLPLCLYLSSNYWKFGSFKIISLSIIKLNLVLCYSERICQIGMTYLCSLGTETAIFSVSLLTKKPFFWQVYFITSVLVFGMSHNIMFLLCVTKGQKILFLFKEVEKLSSVLMYFERWKCQKILFLFDEVEKIFFNIVWLNDDWWDSQLVEIISEGVFLLLFKIMKH